jgi:hypothetical protein
MARTDTETSNGSRENRSNTKGRGRASAQPGTGNVIEGSSLRPVELPQAPPTQSPTPVDVSPQSPTQDRSADRHEAIARSAYYRAEQRGFAPGYEVEDWLEAERELMEKEGGTSLP